MTTEPPMNPKRVFHFCPCTANDLPGMQGWLQDMAAKGHHLSTEGLHVASILIPAFAFEVKEPAQLRYRIHPYIRKQVFDEPPDSLKEMYREFGWDYVCSYGINYHIFVTADPEALEPFLDPDVLAHALKKVRRRVAVPGVLAVLLQLLVIALYIKGFLSTPYVIISSILLVISLWLLYRPLVNLTKKARDGSLLSIRVPGKGIKLHWILEIAALLFGLYLKFVQYS